MKAPTKFRIVLTGDVEAVVKRNNVDQGRHLSYIMERLLTGQEVAPDALESHGITIEVGEG